MRLRNTVTTLTQTAVSTAVNATLHPINTTTEAVGLVKETAGAGLGLVRSRIGRAPHQEPTSARKSAERDAVPPQATVDHVVDEVKQAADDAWSTVADGAQAISAKVAEQATVTKHKAADTADVAKSTASHARKNAAGAAKAVKDKTVGNAAEAKTSVQDEKPESATEPAQKPAQKLSAEKPAAKRTPAKKQEKAPTEKAAAKPMKDDPRDNIPGPDLAPYIPPAPDELPEPIVIVAE